MGIFQSNTQNTNRRIMCLLILHNHTPISRDVSSTINHELPNVFQLDRFYFVRVLFIIYKNAIELPRILDKFS